ncbi:MAG: hypothetical protein IJN88_08475, partial [Clostridia bacterium]|nr:hypothetical protein [Clostridia bacterium]
NYVSNNVISVWTLYQPFPFGNNNSFNKLIPYNFDINSVADFYCYGANGIVYPCRYQISDGVYVTGGESIHGYDYNEPTGTGSIMFAFSETGFRDKHILAYPYQFPSLYLDYFKPPTSEEILQNEQNSLLEEGNKLQQEENETSKSILEKITELPWTIREFFFTLGDRIKLFFEKLVEDIKGLFIPSDGFFDTYQQEFQTYFRERFGILYEIPELVISLLQKFVTFNPKEDDYSITFPEVKLPVLENGEWREEKLIEAQEFSFDFINEAPFSLLYDAYVAFIWLVYILLLVNLIKYKANSVFKGG